MTDRGQRDVMREFDGLARPGQARRSLRSGSPKNLRVASGSVDRIRHGQAGFSDAAGVVDKVDRTRARDYVSAGPS